MRRDGLHLDHGVATDTFDTFDTHMLRPASIYENDHIFIYTSLYPAVTGFREGPLPAVANISAFYCCRCADRSARGISILHTRRGTDAVSIPKRNRGGCLLSTMVHCCIISLMPAGCATQLRTPKAATRGRAAEGGQPY